MNIKIYIGVLMIALTSNCFASDFQEIDADASIVDASWVTAMQSRWGKTTPLKDFDFYQEVLTQVKEEVQTTVSEANVSRKTAKPFNVNKQIKDIVTKYAEKYNVSPLLILAMIKTESGFNPTIVSPKGAKGLMQLMDFNSQAYGIDPFDVDSNVRVGTAILAKLLNKYGDLKLALAAYNAGEGAVEKYGGIPPYEETKNYVSGIISLIDENQF